ncbi:TerB family tellurite resistance protein [Thaumasiovibrio sp. DFM-14]|uniref:tellurite resistance TerB family protein n=1 Tax=Thaumasiovibrio sp. DFM-14 TaxID=3384792 RepID=UPI0039A2BE97
MFKQLKILFRQLANESASSGAIDTPTMNLAMASLLCEVSRADNTIDEKEHLAKIHQLQLLLDITEQEASMLLQQAKSHSEKAISLYDFTSKLRELGQDERYLLIEAMWQVAYADGVLDPLEEAVIRQVADLIYLDHSEYIRAKLSVQSA